MPGPTLPDIPSRAIRAIEKYQRPAPDARVCDIHRPHQFAVSEQPISVRIFIDPVLSCWNQAAPLPF